MIVYNITVKVEAAMAVAWLHWLKTEQAPAMLHTSCFYKFQVMHLLELDDAEGPTYAVQYNAHTMADYEKYTTQFAKRLQQQETDKWGNCFVSFGTLMQIVA